MYHEKKIQSLKIRSVALLGRAKADLQKEFLEKVKAYFLEKGTKVYWDDQLTKVYGDEGERTIPTMLKEVDLVLALGGDGTLLKLVRDLPKRKDLYVMGVNLGNVGFLTESNRDDKLFQILDEFYDQKYIIDDRMILRGTVYRKGKKIATHLALNDIVINQGNFARLISLRAEIDKRKVIEFKADGLIVASPTGSTGHSLSASGPIVHPDVEALVFTPICPSELTVRPIVLPSTRQVSIHIQTERKFKDNQIGLTIDGQIVVPLEYGDEIKIRRSHRRLRFIRRLGANSKYYKLLRDKLRWGKAY